MELEYWEDEPSSSPIEEELYDELKHDPKSLKRYESAEEIFKKFGYQSLRKNKKIDKLKGKNPYKIHEFRFSLENKIGRILFLVGNTGKAVLLHFFAKKQNKIPERNRLIAEKRAQQYHDK